MTDSKAPIDKALQNREANPRRPLLKRDTRVIDIPVDHHPGTVKGDGPSANLARSAMHTIVGSWEKIRDAASDPNVPLERLARASTGAMEKALHTADEADKRIGEQVRHLEQTIHDVTQPRVE